MNIDTLNLAKMNDRFLEFNLGGKETVKVRHPQVVEKIIAAAETLCPNNNEKLLLTGGAGLALQVNDETRPVNDFDFTTPNLDGVKLAMSNLTNDTPVSKDSKPKASNLLQMKIGKGTLSGLIALETATKGKAKGQPCTGVKFTIKAQSNNKSLNIEDNSDLKEALDKLDSLYREHGLEYHTSYDCKNDSYLINSPDHKCKAGDQPYIKSPDDTSDFESSDFDDNSYLNDIPTNSSSAILNSGINPQHFSEVKIEGTEKLTLQSIRVLAYRKSGLIRRKDKYKRDVADSKLAMKSLTRQRILSKSEAAALYSRIKLRAYIKKKAHAIKDPKIRKIAKNIICTSQRPASPPI
jgi:hypothetical protein